MQGDDRLVVGGRRVDEVDHQARLLAGRAAGDAADPLLVDPPRGGRRQVHADRRPRAVPALGEQHRVAEHVDLAALEGGEDLGQLALRRLAGDGAGLDAGVLEGLGDVLGVLDPGRVEDAGDLVEAGLVEVGDRDVEGRLVEQRGELLLVEVLVDLAFAQRHLGDRAHPGAGRDPHAAQRRDHAAPRRLGEVEARGLGREEVGDVAGDQRPGRGHADEDGPGPGADAGAGLLAEGGVRLVADHDRVGVGDPLVVADEPLVGLDRDRAFGVVAFVEQRRAQALLVPAVGDLADELVDQVAAVGEDQHAAGAGRLDETDRGDRLAGAGRVLEPEATLGARVVRRLGDRRLVLPRALGRRFLPVLGLLVGRKLLRLLLGEALLALLAGTVFRGARFGGGLVRSLALRAMAVLGRRLLLGHQLGQRAGEGIDLVRVELGAVAQLRRLLGEQALQPEQQREVAAPLDRGVLGARVELGEGRVQRPAPGSALGKRLRPLAVEQEGLAGELRRALDLGACGNRRSRGNFAGVGHGALSSVPASHAARDGRELGEDRMPGKKLIPARLSEARIAKRTKRLPVL